MSSALWDALAAPAARLGGAALCEDVRADAWLRLQPFQEEIDDKLSSWAWRATRWEVSRERRAQSREIPAEMLAYPVARPDPEAVLVLRRFLFRCAPDELELIRHRLDGQSDMAAAVLLYPNAAERTARRRLAEVAARLRARAAAEL